MTDLNRGLSEVPGLIAERRRYEAWLDALDQRRESTPAHVFERVQADYRTRLQRVAEQLASHRHAIEDERKSVESRLSLLGAEEQMRRDERAELELRSHVGELEGEEAVSAFGAVDESIAHLVGEKGVLQGRISELESLLEPAEPKVATPAAESEPVEAASPEAGAAPDQVAPAASAEPVVHASASEPAPAQAAVESVAQKAEVATETSASDAGADHIGAAAGRHSMEMLIPATAEHPVQAAANAPAPPPRPAVATKAPSPSSSPSSSAPAVGAAADTGQSHRGSDGLHTPSGTFDELKFLDTVVGKEPPKPRGPRASEISPLRGVEGTAREALGVPPLAANVPGNTPIVLRPSVAIDQSKTLKCSECGAANYPTEWYCERCGAELAAL